MRTYIPIPRATPLKPTQADFAPRVGTNRRDGCQRRVGSGFLRLLLAEVVRVLDNGLGVKGGWSEAFAGLKFASFVCNVGGLLAVVAAYALLASPLAASPTLAGGELGAELQALEVAVSRSPDDADALESLVDAYLERSAPGLAQAALYRAPPAIRGLARVADLEARSLSALGLAEEALASQERALKGCSESREPCSNAMLVHAERRVRWLRELVRLSLDDRLPDSAAASLAYRLAVREVRLAVP
jgi:hypothetical protein